MSVKVESIDVEAPPEEAAKLLLDIDKVMERAPRSLVRRWDPSERRADIGLWRGLSGFREIFDVEAEKEDDNIVYTFRSARIMHAFESYRIIIRFHITGSGGFSRISAQLEGEGFNVSRFRRNLENALREWLSSIKSYIEEEYGKLTVEAKGAPARAPVKTPVQASQAPSEGVGAEAPGRTREAPRPAPPQGDPLLEGGRKLRDPLFEAEILLRGQLIYTGSVVATKVADVIDALRGVVGEELSGVYVIKASMGGKEVSLLIENGRLAGAATTRGGDSLGLEAIKELQDLLPAEVFITAIRL